MKIVIFVLSLMIFPINGLSQEKTIPEIESHFFALIVKDIDSSLVWYSEVLGFKIIDKRDFPDSGFKQSNLKRGNDRIELIELNSALQPEEVIPDYTSKTRLIGMFKFGFLVSEFDKFLDHLKEKNVKFHGNVVTNQETGMRMVIIKDPDENRIQLFEK